MLGTRRGRTLLFGGLYLIQGITYAGLVGFVALYLAYRGLGETGIGGVIGVMAIPFIGKVGLGLLTDRYPLGAWGRRRGYILLGLALRGGFLILIPLVSPVGQYPLFLLVGLVAVTGIVLYDVAADGLAIEVTPADDRSYMQGIISAARAMGVVLGGAIGLAADSVSWDWLFWLVGGLSLPGIALVLWFGKPREVSPAEPFRAEAFRYLLGRRPVLIALVGLVYSVATYATANFSNLYIQTEFEIESTAFMGLYTSTFGLGYAAGALVSHLLYRRLGGERGLLVALLVATAGILFLAHIPDRWVAFAAVAAFGMGFGFLEATYFALTMGECTAEIAASAYASFMMVGNVGAAIGSVAAGYLIAAHGFGAMLTILGAVTLMALVPVLMLVTLTDKEAGVTQP